MASEIKNESLLRIMFIFRKTIPRSQAFYSIFIILKFIAPYLLTHNLKHLDTSSVLFSKAISKLTLIQQGSTYHISQSYPWISITIFILIILLISFTSFIAWLYPFIKRDNAKKMQGVPSNSLILNLLLKKTLKGLSYIYLVIILLSQHIVEYVFFGIFINVSHLINQENYTQEKYSLLKALDNQLPFSKTIILVINLLSILLLFFISYLFFILGGTRTVKLTYGSRAITSNKLLLLFVLLFQFQGVYSIVHYFNEDYRNFLRLSFCIAMTALLGIFTVIFIYYGNYITCPSLFCIYFMTLFCFISGLIEIILYFVINSPISVKLSIILKGIEILNPLFIILLVYRRKRNNVITNISNRVFNETPISDTGYLVDFFILLSQYFEGKGVYNQLYQSLYRHFNNCSKEACSCKNMKNKIINKAYNKEKKQIVRILSLAAERDLVQAIIARETSIIPIDSLLLLHVDYLQSVLNKRYLTLYVCQYYLKSSLVRLKFNYAYAIYEVYRIILNDMKKNKLQQKKYLIDECDQKKIDLLKENKVSHKKSKVLQNLLMLQGIKMHLIDCCNDYRLIIKFRQMMKTNKQFRFTCQETIKAIVQLKNRNQELHAILKAYLLKKDVLLPGEECYLLQGYFNLVLGRLPSQYKDRIKEMNSFTEIYFNDNLKQYPIIITSLSIDNVFIIKYATLSLIEQLGYTQKEIIGSDIHANLLWGPFTNSHFAQMKLFVVNGLSQSHRQTFVFSKTKNVFRVNVTTKAIPSKDSLSLIVKCKPLEEQSSHKRNYYALTDQYLNVLATCSLFEQRFFLSQSILNEANISLSQFFGINCEPQMSKTRMNECQPKKSWFDRFKPFQSIQTTVKPEERSLYYEDMALDEKKQMLFDYSITKRKFMKAIELLKKAIQQAGKDKDCIKNIEELYDDITLKNNSSPHSPNYRDREDDNENEALFKLTLEFKYLHVSRYCIAIITENVSSSIGNKNLSQGNCFNMSNWSTIGTQIAKANINQLQVTNLNITNYQFNKKPLPVLFSIEQGESKNASLIDDKTPAMNDSNLHLFSTFKSTEDRRPSVLFSNKSAKRTKGPKDANSHGYELSFVILKTVVFLLVLTLLIIDMVYLLKKVNAFALIKTLFQISISSNLLYSDLYFNAIASLKLCLISNELIDDNYQYIRNRLKVRVNDLMVHYYQLSHFINEMNYTAEIATAYNIFYSNDTYAYLDLNGLVIQKESTFTEEIYTLYFYLSYFNPDTMDKCRLREIFYNDRFRFFTPESQVSTSLEERTLYYLLNNVLKVLSDRMLMLDKQINKQIELFYTTTYVSVIVRIISLSIIGGFLYGTMMALLVLNRDILLNNMVVIFGAIEGEEAFVEHLSKYYDLLNNVCYSQCQLYESKQKPQQVDFTANNSPLMKRTFKSNKKKDKVEDNSYASPFKKQNAKEKEVEKEENEEDMAKPIRDFVRLPLFYFGLLVSLCGLIAYVIIQILAFTISKDDSVVKIAQNHLSTEFLIRIPKLAKLLIYAVRSVLANDLYHLTANLNEYDQYLISNHYNVSIDIAQDSLLSSLNDSFFSLVYYQYRVTSENIVRLYGDKLRGDILHLTIDLEDKANEKNGNLCIQPALVSIAYSFKNSSLASAFTHVSDLVSTCRPLCNGINLNGFSIASEFLLQQFFSFYSDYFKKSSEARSIDAFLSSVEYSQFEVTLQRSFKILLTAQAFLITDDIIQSIDSGSAFDKQLSVLSMLCTALFGFSLFFLFMFRMETYNVIIKEFLHFFLASIRCHNRNEALTQGK